MANDDLRHAQERRESLRAADKAAEDAFLQWRSQASASVTAALRRLRDAGSPGVLEFIPHADSLLQRLTRRPVAGWPIRTVGTYVLTTNGSLLDGSLDMRGKYAGEVYGDADIERVFAHAAQVQGMDALERELWPPHQVLTLSAIRRALDEMVAAAYDRQLGP